MMVNEKMGATMEKGNYMMKTGSWFTAGNGKMETTHRNIFHIYKTEMRV